MVVSAGKTVMGDSDGKKPLLIYLVRHGETALNAENRLRGWTNPPLNQQGRKEARDVGEHLAATPLKKLYVSDLIRAIQTSNAIEADQAEEPRVIVTDRLRPINFGDWNGELLSEVEPKMR
jgi:broad specificity phosphatase PhoE